MLNNYLQFFRKPRSAALLLLGFSSGLPLALTSSTLQAWLTLENIDISTIGLFTLAGQAYIFKFFWSPLMDRYTIPGLGRRRGWLLLSQLLLLIAIAVMGFLQPASHLLLMAVLATLIAFFSASQDIVFDAWKTDVLPASERGLGSAISVLGYRIAMLASGGLALWLAARWPGWHGTYWLMAALLIPCIITTLLTAEPQTVRTPNSLKQAVIEPLTDFFSRNNAWLLLLLIIAYKLGDAFALSLSTTFLLSDRGFSLDQLALVNKTLGIFATLSGVLLGGILMQRMSLFRALWWFGILQAMSNAGYWLLSINEPHITTMAAVVFFENLCGGMGTAAFVALLMTLCNSNFSATQFALLSALAAVGRVYVGPLAAWFVKAHGWPLFFLFSIAAALPGLLLLLICRGSLEYIWQHGTFISRQYFHRAYRLISYLLLAAAVSLLLWLILISARALDLIQISISPLLILTVVLACGSLLYGALLDHLAQRKNN